MKTYVEVKNGKVWGSPISRSDDRVPEFAPGNAITVVEVTDLDAIPAEGSTWDGSAFSPPETTGPEAPSVNELQAQWDCLRNCLIEKHAGEAQLKMLEGICENLGVALPAEITTIREIRAAENPGDPLP